FRNVRVKLKEAAPEDLEIVINKSLGVEIRPSSVVIPQGEVVSDSAEVHFLPAANGLATVGLHPVPTVPTRWKGISEFTATPLLEAIFYAWPVPDLYSREYANAVDLTFNLPNSHQAIPRYRITDYEYRFSSDDGASWSQWTKVADGMVAQAVLVTGLSGGTEYRFELRTVSSDDAGPAATVVVTPLRPQPLPQVDNQVAVINDNNGLIATLPEANFGVPPYTYALSGTKPEWLTFFPQTRRLWGGTPRAAGQWNLTYQATDATDAVQTQEFTLKARATENRPPEGLNRAGQKVDSGTSIGRKELPINGGFTVYDEQNVSAMFRDPDGDTLTFQLNYENLPANMRLHGQGIKVISDQILMQVATADKRTEGTITVTADDGHGGRETRPLTLIGYPPPDNAVPEFTSDAAVADLQLEVGREMTPLVLPAAVGGDRPPVARGDAPFELRYRTSVLPAGLYFDAATRTLSGAPKAGTVGTHVVEVRADDRDANETQSDAAIQRFTIRIVPGICIRTAAVRTALVAASGAADCAAVSKTHLAAIETLDLSGTGLVQLLSRDLKGLSGLRNLDLSDNRGLSVSAGLFVGLSSLRTLKLNGLGLTSLPEGLSTRLPNLEELSLNRNRLSLTAGMFAGFSRVQRLALRDNVLTGLPDLVFVGLESLLHLDLGDNALNTINQNPFITTELGNPVSRQIQTLSLRNNRFSRLTQDSLRPFRGVQELDLSGNRLQTLSAPAFSNNKALRSLDLRNNPGAPFAQFVELESNDEGTAIRARLAGTIPFNTAVTLSATRAELDATEITIAAGEQFSEWVTVTPAGTGDVFILITETEFVTGDVYGFEAKVGDSTILFSVPDAPTVAAVAEDASAVLSWTESFSGTAPIAVWHYRVSADGGTNWTPDWTIVPSDAGPESLRIENLTNDTEHIFEISAVSVVGRGAAGRAVATPSAPKGVCDRSEAVKNAIVTALAVESCADVRHSRLADITDLNLNNSALTALDSGDFAGLTALTDLDLSENSLSSLPDAVFDKLTALTDLNLSDNSLSSLPAAVFDKLTALTDLDLSDNRLSSLPAGLFDGLTTLTMLDLSGNTVDPIPLDVTLQAVEDAEGKIQVHIAQGAPFAITVPLTATNAELSASSVTIAAGSQNSPQVTLTPDEKGTVSAELGTLTLSLPTGFTSLKLNGGAELSVLFSPYAPEVTATPDHRAVGLTWTAGFDGGAAVTDWEIRHRPAEGEWGVWQKFGSATPSKHEIVNLENGTEYEFEVRALRGTLVVGAAGKATATPVPANTAPVFTDTDPVTRTLAENTAENTNLGDPIVATDAGDGNDETPTLTYILRGDDAAQFAIDSGTGQITVAEDAVLDFETKSSLKVIVDVHDGRDESGDEEVTPVVDASMPVNITLTDLLEPPARPSTASITATGASANSIQVSWTEPTNTGPPITDYDVRFRGALDDDYIDAGYDGVDREVLLLGLQPVSDYQIAVRARNEEGTGPWSRDSLGKTLAEPDNLTPSADAGPDQDVLVGSTVTLDGSASADLDEHPLTYSWTQLSGTTVTLDDSTAQMPSFTAPSTVGTLQFRLIVNDRRVDSSPDDVDIRVLAMPTTPNAPQEVSAQGHDRLIALKWKAGTDGGAAITAWQLRQASGTDDIEDSTWDTITSSSSPARTKRSHRVEVDNGVATEFQVRAMNSEGDGAASATVSATASLPTGGICDRTESVRDAIVDALPAEEVVDCGDVNDARLESLTGLSLSTKGLTALASGDLDGLSGLTSLDLSTNSLLDLPTGIFDELTELTTLNLSSNGLTLLDGELFKHTTKLESLNLSNNDLTFLDGKLFKYTTKLESLNLGTNHLTVLPAGLFDGLTAFTSLKLNDNQVYPMRLNISFEFTNDEKTEGRVRVMQGAPFNITVELTAVNATLSTDSVTIERGSVVSPTVTITPTFNGEITIGQSSITRRPLSFRTELVYQGTVNESVAAPPGAPTLTAQSGNKFIDLSWSESNNGGSAITGWEYRWSDDNGENWDPSEGWHSLALATTELQLSGTNGTELTVELRAVNARGSGPATQVKATPTPDNSAPTFDDGENATRAVPENSTVDSNGDPVTVGTAITATDQDEGDVLTYALVDDEDSEDDEAFTINTESGQLSVAADANL
ncbi:MAG: leucine-rich repeat protein, partial [Gammaproteobacteria bacterium]|nr:leucine-rich repeat protein [Gammaproteobacteria bacterium]